MRNRCVLFILLGLFAFLGGVGPARADCTTVGLGTKPSGYVFFNRDAQVLQYCDDTNWRRIGPYPSKPVGCPNIGDTCSDGSIYAGLSPDGNVPMYTTPADAPSIITWNDGTTNYNNAMTNCLDVSPGTAATCRTGEANTAFLVGATGEPDYPFAAAAYCNGLSAHGYSDWYLPAQDEVNVLYTNKNTGDLNGTFNETGSYPAGYYWSSSPRSLGNARNQRFSNGNQDAWFTKATSLAVRCVRKEAPELTSVVPDGLIGHWKLDETSGTTAFDYASANNGTMVGGLDAAVDSVAGRLGTALNYTGSGESINLGNPSDLNNIFATGGTISGWFWVDPAASTYRFFDKNQPSFGGYLVTDFLSGSDRVLRFDADFVSGGWDTLNPIPTGRWFHLAVVYDASSTANDPQIYFDGVLQSTNEWDAPAAAGDDSSNILHIANRNDLDRAITGDVDDVRIYNRALTAEDVTYLYQSFDGNIKYDTESRVPKYFNGDKWVAMGKKAYVPNAVEFDGTNDYLTYFSPLTGVTDGTRVTASFWYKMNTYPAAGCHRIVGSNPGRFDLVYCGNGTETMQMTVRDTGGAIAGNVGCGPDPHVVGQWYHHLISVDVATGATNCYVNDADSEQIFTAPVNTTLDLTLSQYAVGAATAGSSMTDGDIADLWVDFNTYIDFSVAANRRKFIDAGGGPVDLGADGSLPTGSAPDIFLSGDTATWHTNKGTGGGFTENGALTDAITEPGGPFLPTEGLVGYWKLDEVSGSSVIDYASANNGTWMGSSNVQPTSGIFGGAQYFSPSASNEVDLGRPSDLDMSVTNAFTVSAWVKPQDTYNGVIFARGAVQSSEINTVYLVRRYLHTDQWNAVISDGVTACSVLSGAGNVEFGVWQHIVVTWNGTNLTIYKNGTSLDSADCTTGAFTALWDGGGTSINRDTSIGADARANRYYWDGGIDDVAVYNRALSQSDIQAMYNAGICTNPTRINGSMVYNADNNIMQYCDSVSGGTGWKRTMP